MQKMSETDRRRDRVELKVLKRSCCLAMLFLLACHTSISIPEYHSEY